MSLLLLLDGLLGECERFYILYWLFLYRRRSSWIDFLVANSYFSRLMADPRTSTLFLELFLRTLISPSVPRLLAPSLIRDPDWPFGTASLCSDGTNLSVPIASYWLFLSYYGFWTDCMTRGKTLLFLLNLIPFVGASDEFLSWLTSIALGLGGSLLWEEPITLGLCMKFYCSTAELAYTSWLVIAFDMLRKPIGRGVRSSFPFKSRRSGGEDGSTISPLSGASPDDTC